MIDALEIILGFIFGFLGIAFEITKAIVVITWVIMGSGIVKMLLVITIMISLAMIKLMFEIMFMFIFALIP